MTINMFSLQFYISDLTQYFVGCCVCVHVCLCYDLFLHDCVFPQLVWTLGPWQTVPQWRPSLRQAGGHLEPSQRNPWTAFSAQSWTKWLLMVSVGDQASMFSHSSNTGTSHRD